MTDKNIFLTKHDILLGITKISNLAKERHILLDIAIYGGAALSLAFDMRDITKDVDVTINKNQDKDFLREASEIVAEEMNWSLNWLNDGVKGFISHNEILDQFDDMTNEDGGVRIFVPSAEYLFSMKCMSMRPEGVDGSHDFSDIENPAKLLQIKNADEAFSIVERFYPMQKMPTKVYLGIEEIIEGLSGKNTPAPGQ